MGPRGVTDWHVTGVAGEGFDIFSPAPLYLQALIAIKIKI
jgi:hypothetical protein